MRGPASNNTKAPVQGSERKVSRKQIIGYLLFNFTSTVCVTFINKICFSRVNFGYPAALCNIHYAITWMGVEAMRRLNMFVPLTHPPSSLRADVQFRSIAFLIGTVTPLNNTSLKLNSIGFYQLIKLLVTPAVVLLEYALDGKILSRKRAASLVAVCVFVLVSSGADLEFNAFGTICAAIWVPLAASWLQGTMGSSSETIQLLNPGTHACGAAICRRRSNHDIASRRPPRPAAISVDSRGCVLDSPIRSCRLLG